MIACGRESCNDCIVMIIPEIDRSSHKHHVALNNIDINEIICYNESIT